MGDNPQSQFPTPIHNETPSLGVPSSRNDNYVTVTLVLLIWAVQIYFLSNPSAAQEAGYWGGMSAYWLAAGQWWRSLTYIFLHGGWHHLALNTFFIFVFGRPVERALGHAGFLFLFLTTILAASLSGWLRIEPIGRAGGASGAVFGLLGSWVYLRLNILSRISHRSRLKAVGWLVIILIIYGPNSIISLTAHVIGLITGFCAMAITWHPHFRFPRTRRWRPQFILVTCTLLLVLSPLAFYPNPIKLLQRADEAINRGAYDEAIDPLGKLIRYFPDYDWSYDARIFCYLRLDMEDEALREIERAIQRFPRSADLRMRHGDILLEKGLTDKAKADIEAAYRLNPKDLGTYYYNMGRLYFRTGDYAHAVEYFNSALQSKYYHLPVQTLIDRGLALCGLGRLDEAEADWRKALATDQLLDDKSRCQMYLGFLELRRGHWDAALKFAVQVEAHYQQDPFIGLLRLIAAEKLGHKESSPEADQVYSKFVHTDLSDLKALLPRELYTYLDKINSCIPEK